MAIRCANRVLGSKRDRIELRNNNSGGQNQNADEFPTIVINPHAEHCRCRTATIGNTRSLTDLNAPENVARPTSTS